ncbi:atlastin-1-like isoform X2 [Varroa jacobsoni]|uniref:atlastin-1-like isoform X2 n=1 Tax=Varroa jacobsoni TaxID=62625 RepID=UPI000BF52929|nr:atlastin-1-like isoform X2 [Varroa jacobsoni]
MATEDRKPDALCIFSLNKKLEAFGCADLRKYFDTNGEMENLKVAVVSIAGMWRSERRFLLSCIIRYLRSGGAPDWFHARKQAEAVKWENFPEGVALWPEIFKVRQLNGEDVAVLVMDTQGLYGTKNASAESTAVLCFSVLLASIQIYNVYQHIRGTDLYAFENFLKFVSKSVFRAPLGQKLVFVVSDWPVSLKYPYGWEGGQDVLQEELFREGHGAPTSQFLKIGRCIKKTFTSVQCYLMPYPGEDLVCSACEQDNKGKRERYKQFIRNA